jgi:hypothetical protein
MNVWDAAEFRDICSNVDLKNGKEDGKTRPSV